MQLTPPIALEAYKKLRNRKHVQDEPDYIWEGIYTQLSDVPSEGEAFDGEPWLKMTRSHTEELLRVSKNYGVVPTEVVDEHNLLPLLVAAAYRDRPKVTILDFGGGMGISYIHLTKSLVGAHDIDYYVMERERICVAGSPLFEMDKHVHFLRSAFPATLPRPDIVHLNSVLQYIEDYSGFLREICSLRAEFILFVKLSAGDIPTYATAQRNVPGSVIPYWFINSNELIELMASQGYTLLFKGALSNRYNQENFPIEYRIERACNLLFSLGKRTEPDRSVVTEGRSQS